MHPAKFVPMLKIPYPSVVKEEASQQVVWKRENNERGGGGAAHFPWETQPEFTVHCIGRIGTRKLSNPVLNVSVSGAELKCFSEQFRSHSKSGSVYYDESLTYCFEDNTYVEQNCQKSGPRRRSTGP